MIALAELLVLLGSDNLPCILLSQINAWFLFIQDQILRKPNGLAWVLFTDSACVQRAVEYYNSGQAFMYGTPFVISTLDVDVMADTGSEENSEAKARSVAFVDLQQASQCFW